MKWIVRVVVALLVVAAVGFQLYKAPFSQQAEDFFAAVKQKNMQLTLSYLSADNKVTSSADQEFNNTVKDGVDFKFKEAGWLEQVSLFSHLKMLYGTVQPDANKAANRVKIVFTKESGQWKIAGVVKADIDIKSLSELSQPPKPQETTLTEDQKVKLIQKTVLSFLVSKKDKSMKYFYSSLSKTWQAQTTVEKLDDVYKSVAMSDADIDAIANMVPTPLNDMITPEGLLVLVGIYATKPKAWVFEQDFIKEDGQWQLAVFKMGQMDNTTQGTATSGVPESTPVPGQTSTAMVEPIATAAAVPTATLVATATAVPVSTEKPVPTQKPTATPKPTATLKPVPTQKPTATPKPTATLKPVPTQKPTATPKPTATLKPVSTQTPTAMPKPTAMVKPTATPKPMPVEKPTAKPKPTKKPAATPTAAAVATQAPVPTPTMAPTVAPTPTRKPDRSWETLP